jgi:prepilin-type N-terminal cleavage/methylation domain-containing protein
MPDRVYALTGFTLAELLICLAILGEIATFTIPKILTSQQNGSYNAKAKEVIAMISIAYQQAQFAGTVTTSTKPTDLTPYMNYVGLDTVSWLDGTQTIGVYQDCPSSMCLKLHNGAILLPYSTMSFNGTGANNAIVFKLDPDGKATDGTTNGPGKSLEIILFYNGRIATRGSMGVTAVSSDGSRTPAPAQDPPWFQW